MATGTLRREDVASWHDDLPNTEWVRGLQYNHSVVRTGYLAGRIMLRRAIGAVLDQAPVDIVLEYDDYGKLHVKNSGTSDSVYVNISHTEGLSIVALSRVAPLGIDVESSDRYFSQDFERAMCSQDERLEIGELPISSQSRARVRLWTLKEALVKASGEGLRASLTAISCATGEEHAIRVRRLGSIPGNPGDWCLYVGCLPGNFLYAVAQRAARTTIYISSSDLLAS